jgi:site-specific recombinase XerD
MLVANGTNVRVVSEPLGHSTASFTLSVYVHPDEAAAVAAINDAERMLGG